MKSSRVAFDVAGRMEWGDSEIVMMECYRVVNGVRKEKLPFVLTVEEVGGGRFEGYLSLEHRKRIRWHWVSEMGEDDFFSHAEGVVETYLVTKRFPDTFRE